MINQALEFLVANLNEYVLMKTGLGGKVKLGHLVGAGGAEVTGDNSIVCQLVNLDEERVGKAQLPVAPPVGTSYPVRNPQIRMNLSMLVTTNPGTASGDYSNGIRLLSYVVQYFQGNHFFTTENSPSLDPAIGTLIVELYPISLENQNYLWGSLGVKYRPSVVYKIRLVTILDDKLHGSVASPVEVDLNGKLN